MITDCLGIDGVSHELVVGDNYKSAYMEDFEVSISSLRDALI